MRKTIIVIIIFIAIIILIALSFSFFVTPEKKLRYNQCVLLQDPKTKVVDCFGCTKGICKDAPTTWILYEKPEVGIPYACFESEQGCSLAQ